VCSNGFLLAAALLLAQRRLTKMSRDGKLDFIIANNLVDMCAVDTCVVDMPISL
jgi:hypothetical protein